jgi:phosphoribosyl-AMP cyclohydrolase / phosphoribosyl-ATP pyrophosphohydrolase
MIDLERLDFAKGGGTVTVVAQDARTGRVLMVAAADREALQRTADTGEAHYRSRSRGLWHKGATSGNTQRVLSLTPDCDGDAVLARVIPAGPACHRGTATCFGEPDAGSEALPVLEELDRVIAERMTTGESAGYTGQLLGDRNRRLKKLGEEAAELAVACADGERGRVVSEAADLVYHLLVAVRAAGGSWEEVCRELQARRS